MKELCRDRVALEGSLKPPHEASIIATKHEAVVMANETVFAFPPASTVGCETCGKAVGPKDIRFHVVYQPRGYMAPPFDSTLDTQGGLRPWEITPPFSFLTNDGQDKARQRAKVLATEYSDYSPVTVCYSSEYKDAVRAGSKKTRKVPPEVAEVRFKWPDST